MEQFQQDLDLIWMMVCAMLVFLMQAGFTLVEAGFTRAKHSISVAMKNISDILVTSVVFSLIGFPLMFGTTQGGFIGKDGFFFAGTEGSQNDWAFLFFQVVFAGTAATIVSGAIAERTKFVGYIIGTFFITLLIYPLFGHWAWGGLLHTDQKGWLEQLGFMDFAGSTVVHSIGGWIALAAIIVLGPRIGKYNEDGTSNHFQPSNLPLATLGVFMLWFGWFGFNGGSVGSVDTSIALIIVNTCLGGAAGGLLALVVSWIWDKLPKVEDVLNGILAGLVSITAACNIISPASALLIGGIGGCLYIVIARFIDKKLRLDDVVGAVAVHGVSGAWGTLAVALFGKTELLALETRLQQLGVQAIGVLVAFVWAFALGYVICWCLNKLSLLRVGSESEAIGLNISEHGAKTALLETIQTINSIIGEKIDLTRKLKIEPGDDTAEINEAINFLVERMNELVGEVKGQTQLVHVNSDNMLDLSSQLKTNITSEYSSIQHTYDILKHSQTQLDKESYVEQMIIDGLERFFLHIKEVAAETQNIREDMNGIEKEAGNVEVVLKHVKVDVEKLFQLLSAISDFSKESNHVIETITNTAEKINILSLNAGIEAMQSNGKGSGFVVLSNEIKKLANETKVSSAKIKSILEATGEKMEDGVIRSREFKNTFEKLNKSMYSILENIKKPMTETENMYKDMQNLLDKLEKVQKDTMTIQQNRLRQKNEFEELMGKMNSLLSQIENSNTFTQTMDVKAAELKSNSHFLGEMVQQFKTAYTK